MSTVRLEPLLRQCLREYPRLRPESKKIKPSRLNYSLSLKLFSNCRNFSRFDPHRFPSIRASSTDTAFVETSDAAEHLFKETFILKRSQTIEGKVSVRLDRGKEDENWELVVGCNLPGEWILHWGVTYIDGVDSEWDQPPLEMRPPGSIPIKDYAIESPFKKSSETLEGEALHKVQIAFYPNTAIAAIHFVLKDEETGAWCQHRGRDFKVPLLDYVHDDANIVGAKKGFGIWPGALGQISNLLHKAEGSQLEGQEDTREPKDSNRQNRRLEGFYEEHLTLKEVSVQNFVTVSVRKCSKKDNNLVHLETDLPGDVVVHWGVCRGNDKKWEIPPAPHPPETKAFKKNALQNLLQPKEDGHGSWGLFSLNKDFTWFLFVLKLNGKTWLNNMGSDFHIPLSSAGGLITPPNHDQGEAQEKQHASVLPKSNNSDVVVSEGLEAGEANRIVASAAYTDEILNEIRNLVSDISSERIRKTKSKEAQESILQEIEKLAAEAYSSFTNKPTQS